MPVEPLVAAALVQLGDDVDDRASPTRARGLEQHRQQQPGELGRAEVVGAPVHLLPVDEPRLAPGRAQVEVDAGVVDQHVEAPGRPGEPGGEVGHRLPRGQLQRVGVLADRAVPGRREDPEVAVAQRLRGRLAERASRDAGDQGDLARRWSRVPGARSQRAVGPRRRTGRSRRRRPRPARASRSALPRRSPHRERSAVSAIASISSRARCVRRRSSSPLLSSQARCSASAAARSSSPVPARATVLTIGGFQRSRPAPVGRLADHRPQVAAGLVGALAVGLVDDEDVADLQDPGLRGLDAVAHPGRQQDDGGVRQPGDLDLALADADGLDEHHVEARRRPARAAPAGSSRRGRRGARARPSSGCRRPRRARGRPSAPGRRAARRRRTARTGPRRGRRPACPRRAAP